MYNRSMRDWAPPTIQFCIYCKNPFKIQVSHVISGRGRFCSLRCCGLEKRGKERVPFKIRFFDNIKKGPDCWEWKTYKMPNGYGTFTNKITKTRLAHRISYILNKGSIPKGFCVLHHCDNRSCVNPNHLWLGTQADNTRDMLKKGRGHYQRLGRQTKN